MAPRKIIIDTDPGVDDMLAMLLALSASPEELEVLLISLTFGNIDIENCLRNTISMFHVLELEKQWRIQNNLPTLYNSLDKVMPLVAVGADRPLEDQIMEADYFHGLDGLGGVHSTAPHFTPTETWSHAFTSTSTTPAADLPNPPNFIPTATPAHRAILEILAQNPPDTITIVAVGPLTNLSLAASEDLPTFLRAKELVIMGGAIDLEGNVTPKAEFNHYACAFSAAHIYALTSPNPTHTLPPSKTGAFDIAEKPSKKLNLSIVPLDITMQHLLTERVWNAATEDLISKGSPLASWADVFLKANFKKMTDDYVQEADLSLHDPLCIWYLISSLTEADKWQVQEDRDIRIETTGQWTRGACIVDKRSKKVEQNLIEAVKLGDVGVWLHMGYGNRVRQIISSPEGHNTKFGGWMLERIFGIKLYL